MKAVEYAIYKGDRFLAIGTKKELAEMLGVTEKTVAWYSMPAYIKRTEGRGMVAVNLGVADEV